MPEGDKTKTIKVVCSDELLEEMKIRDAECNLVRVDLGKPDADGFYSPRMTRVEEDNPLTAAKAEFTKAMNEKRVANRKLADENTGLRREVKEAERSAFEKLFEEREKATALWQAAHPDEGKRLPDMKMLLLWLMEDDNRLAELHRKL